MSQVFHCVKCFSCDTFQVQQVKKVNKWSCKVCGNQQSLLKEYGRGSGADCRRHVQKLNAMRGAKIEEDEMQHNTWLLCDHTEEQVRPARCSRWNKYLDSPEEAEPEEGFIHSMHLHGNPRSHSGRMEGHSEHRPTPEQAVKASHFAPSLDTDCQTPESRSLSVDSQAHGRSLRATGVPTHPLPVSMFESGEDFSVDIF